MGENWMRRRGLGEIPDKGTEEWLCCADTIGDYGLVMRSLRKRAGLTMGNLATVLRIPVHVIAHIEHGRLVQLEAWLKEHPTNA